MKILREIVYLCDNCRKDVTDKKHIRIHLVDLHWKKPPYEFVSEATKKKPVMHYCKVECMIENITKLLDETDIKKSKGEGAGGGGGQVSEAGGPGRS